LNLRNRLIWIAALSVAFAAVQLVASQRKGERELIEYVTSKLMVQANECARQTHEHGTLTLQAQLVPDGKLDTIIERIEAAPSSKLSACIIEHTKALSLKLPLPSPKQLTLTLPIEPPTAQ
jgi:hypothetical protein